MGSLRWGSPIFEWLSIRSHCLMTWMIWGTITLEPVDTGSTWPCGLGASDHHLDRLVQINPEMGKRKEITTVLVGFYQFISCRICWMDLENIGYEARRSHRKSGFETDVIPVFPYVYIYMCRCPLSSSSRHLQGSDRGHTSAVNGFATCLVT